MDFRKINENYKLKDSYTNKFGFKDTSYVLCYYDANKKIYIQNEITRSCLDIYDKIKK